MQFFRILFLLISLFIFQPAFAEDATERLFYKVYWSGFKVGEMRYVTNVSDEGYNIVATINSTGVAEYAWKYSSVNVVNGSIKNDVFVPKRYHSMWWRKDEKQDIELIFSENGDVIKETLLPPEKEGKRPEVGAGFKKAVLDPVTAALVSRETIRKEIEKNPVSRETFIIPSFDAKRRFDIVAEIKGFEEIHLGGKIQELLHVNIKREPVAGFREKDLKEMAEENQNIDFYLDKDFVPVWAVAKAKVGRATIKLIR